jgi:hypothetical protein
MFYYQRFGLNTFTINGNYVGECVTLKMEAAGSFEVSAVPPDNMVSHARGQ